MTAQCSLKRTRNPSPVSSTKRCRLENEAEAPETVKFLILSDTHDAAITLPPSDVLLHCGDLTEDGSPTSLKAALAHLSKAKAELKLFIAGNHEISFDKNYYLSEGGSLSTHEESLTIISDYEASTPGLHFLKEGTHTFTLKSGATFTIYASPYTPRYGSSAFQYPSGKDRFNYEESTPKWAKNVGTEKSRIPTTGIDIVMTHGPAQYILDKTADNRSAGCEHLSRAIARSKPLLHCFGHVHRGYGAQRIEYDDDSASGTGDDGIKPLPQEFVGKNQARRKGFSSLSPGAKESFLGQRERRQTLMVNAAVMDSENEPGNMPWLVELDLAKKV
ncbi:hypothetical protein CC80DRAFT_468558 [Byssothecium circinans]|uniref:Calcineurin-like phosphoesterase domain-containing protein n=1 Tax=Byssothecium circinans TaxID=147558 RepID=A0A6A5U2B3_9PLEO|nr:hypothetical protein CC80DRAFT_468558 [Byssothecium circinans]